MGMEKKTRIEWHKGKTRRYGLGIFVLLSVIISFAAIVQAASKPKLVVSSIQIAEKKAVTIQVAKKKNFTITYRSSNKKVASVSEKGKVTGNKKGKAKITVYYSRKGGRRAKLGTVSVTVTKKVNSKPVVYMTKNITPAGMEAVYQAVGKKLKGKTAVKLSTGEAGDTYYLAPSLIKNLVQDVNGTIVECNTAYGGSRSSEAKHMQVAKDHGFTQIAKVDIMDAKGSMSIPVVNGSHLSQNYVGKNLKQYDSVLVLSHFKGHAMAGFGGALKNISIGIASSKGKAYIHSGGSSTTDIWGGKQDDFLESMAEAAFAVMNYKKNQMVYVNVMNNLSVDCDCDSSPARPTMKDIGILASTDPVALDQACVDLVYGAEDGKDLVRRIENRNGVHLLDYADKIGVGSKKYTLKRID